MSTFSYSQCAGLLVGLLVAVIPYVTVAMVVILLFSIVIIQRMKICNCAPGASAGKILAIYRHNHENKIFYYYFIGYHR